MRAVTVGRRPLAVPGLRAVPRVMIEPAATYYDDEDGKTHGNDEAGKNDAIAAVQGKCESATGDVLAAIVEKM